MTTNEISFTVPEYIIAEDVDAYVKLIQYIKLWYISEENCIFICLWCRNGIIRQKTIC